MAARRAGSGRVWCPAEGEPVGKVGPGGSTALADRVEKGSPQMSTVGKLFPPGKGTLSRRAEIVFEIGTAFVSVDCVAPRAAPTWVRSPLSGKKVEQAERARNEWVVTKAESGGSVLICNTSKIIPDLEC
jgi:hypothetical protein